MGIIPSFDQHPTLPSERFVPHSMARSFDAQKRQEPSPSLDNDTATKSSSSHSQTHSTSTTHASKPSNKGTTTHDLDNDTNSHSTKTKVTLGAALGITALLVFALLLYRILRRHRGSKQSSVGINRTKNKGDTVVYAPVHNSSVNQGVLDIGQEEPGWGQRWWHSLTPLGSFLRSLPLIGGRRSGTTTTASRKKERPRTLYRVRRQKPGGSFEIDSDVTTSMVDLRAGTQ